MNRLFVKISVVFIPLFKKIYKTASFEARPEPFCEMCSVQFGQRATARVTWCTLLNAPPQIGKISVFHFFRFFSGKKIFFQIIMKLLNSCRPEPRPSIPQRFRWYITSSTPKRSLFEFKVISKFILLAWTRTTTNLGTSGAQFNQY